MDVETFQPADARNGNRPLSDSKPFKHNATSRLRLPVHVNSYVETRSFSINLNRSPFSLRTGAPIFPMAKKKYKYVNDLWKDSEVKKLDPANRLIYRSNKLGSDQRITNTGGGNTSSKLMETDPLTGEKVEVLWVKAPAEPAHQEGEFCLALSGEIDRAAKRLREEEKARAQDARRG